MSWLINRSHYDAFHYEKGGGDGGMAQMMMMQMQQQQAEAARERADKAAKDASDHKKFKVSAKNAYDDSSTSAHNMLASRGLVDPEYQSLVDQALGKSNRSITPDDPNVSTHFDGVAEGALSAEQANRIGRFTSDFDKFAPQNFQNNRIQDTLDDSILDQIMSTQYDDASKEAKLYKDRGILTDEGYQGAQKSLDKQKPGVMSNLQTIGQNFLNSERTNLADKAGGFRNSINNYKLGDKLDVNDFNNQLNNEYDSWFKGLGDKIKGVTPSLFDTSDLLNIGGKAQGPVNSSFVGETDTADPNKKKSDTATTQASVF